MSAASSAAIIRQMAAKESPCTYSQMVQAVRCYAEAPGRTPAQVVAGLDELVSEINTLVEALEYPDPD